MKTLLSLFDYSGVWSAPYKEHGWKVFQIDIKRQTDVFDIELGWLTEASPITGVLAAPPCTDFSVSGAQYWKRKDEEGRTARSLSLVYKTLEIIRLCSPKFWALENPIGRLPKLIPGLGPPWYFQPYWYGDAYTKKTGLWGDFNRPVRKGEVLPVKVCKQGSWVQKLGGKSERTKTLRSATPKGFALAFFEANH